MVIGRLLVMEIRPLQTDVHLGNLVLLNLISRGMLFCGGNGKEIERRKRVNFVFSIESQNYNVKNIGNDLSAKNADKDKTAVREDTPILVGTIGMLL